ncbi:MAG: phosphoribosylformylglycinamidine cyclo-ligase, partial [Eubacterium sp.]
LEDYDLAGFAVGVAEKEEIVTGQNILEGDVLVGLPSTGVHSNGFSLVRKLLFKDLKMDVHTKVEALGKTLGETLLTPTKIYVKAMENCITPYGVKGMSHVTGGGFYENIPRMIPDGLCAKVEISRIEPLPIFTFIEESGKITKDEMFSTFNMGIGLVIALPAEKADSFVTALKDKGEKPVILGEVVKGDKKIELC